MENELFKFISKYIELTTEEKNVLLDLNLFRSYPKGSVLLKAGEFSNDYYFVLKGCIRCYYEIDGEEKTTAFYTEAESLAPLCTMNKKASDHYIDCVEDCILSVATPEIEQEVFTRFPRFVDLCRVLTEQLLAESQTSFANFKTSSPEQRYLQLLETRPSLLQRVPQRQIASYLGIKPESLSRIRRRLLDKKK